MTNEPAVGLVLARTAEDHDFVAEPAYRFEFLKEQYYEPLEKQGLLPLGIPATERRERVPSYCDLISGLLLIGGEDINPDLYGAELDERTVTFPPRRDRLELELIQECRKRRIPILGICRGLQMLNVACGGTLYQDLSYRSGAADHRQGGELDYSTRHSIEIVPDTRLHRILEVTRAEVNTGHHQGLNRLGTDLITSATAPDGTVEAIETTTDFTLAVQWHPESWAADPVSQRLFAAFAEAVRQYRAAQKLE